MSESALDANQWLDLVIAKAEALRASGVTTITVGNCSVQLAELPPLALIHASGPTPRKDPEPNHDMDPLGDPALFGGSLPGFDLSGVEKLIKEIEHA